MNSKSNASLEKINSTTALRLLCNTRRKRRLLKPTGDYSLLERAQKKRRSDTFEVCAAIHGGSRKNVAPVVSGVVDLLTKKFKTSIVAALLLNQQRLRNTLEHNISEKRRKVFYASKENDLRSLNTYYSCDVLGKRKYISIRKANRHKSVPNFLSYARLAKNIKDIDIGEIYPIAGTLDEGVGEEETGQGFYRDVRKYAPRLAEFYLRVDKSRTDKLLSFDDEKFKKIDPSSTLFLLSIGGDEAPLSGTTFLLSFINSGRRICSSYDNFLIFGGNVKENGEVVRRYLKRLHDDIQYLESKLFEINVDGISIKVEFRLELVPNDMKMMCFISGELSNAAFYFSSFAKVTKENCYDFSCRFNGKHKKDWQPFSYQKRLEDVQRVEKKKQQLAQKGLKKVWLNYLIVVRIIYYLYYTAVYLMFKINRQCHWFILVC